MTRPRIGFLLPHYSARSQSQMPRVLQLLADAGAQVDVINPAGRVVDLSGLRVEHDLYVLKKISGLAFSLAGALHARGAAIMNPYPASVALRDKIVAFRVLQAAGLPTPASHAASQIAEFAPLLEAGPIIVKPYQGSSGYGVRVVRTAAELAEILSPEKPVFAQRYHPPDGRDLKLYVIGDRVFGTLKVFPAVTEAEKHGEPFTPSPELCEIARECGRAFGIDLYGVDIIESGGRPYVVDMSSMPGFKGVPDAPSYLAQFFYAAAERAARGERLSDRAAAIVEPLERVKRGGTPPPTSTLPQDVSAKRRETLLAHPAVQAWQRLGPDHAVPHRVTPAKVKPNRMRPRTVYRLEGVGAHGSAIIAKRCKRRDGVIERAVYGEIFPRVPLTGPQYYGAVESPSADPEQDVCWIFIGEITGEQYDRLQPEHRAAAARWLGILHSAARAAPGLAVLPDAGPGRYRAQMRGARDVIREHLHNPALTADDLTFLEGLLARFDDLDEHWDRLDGACAGLPPTLVHGDFNGKNLRVQASAAGLQILAFDWEDCGRSVPTTDLAQVVATASSIAADPDLAIYGSVLRQHGLDCDQQDVERLATCGGVFRALAVIEWDSHHLAHDWADAFVPSLRLYEAELVHALGRLGWARRTSSTPPQVVGS